MATVRAIRPDMEQPRGAVSNAVYDIVCMFQSKLEALAAYEKYAGDFKDDANGRKLVEQIRADDERHVGMLRAEIERLCSEGKFR